MSGSRPAGGVARPPAAIWQDVEFGAYVSDLGLWTRLAEGRSPVLELGAGSGRVALHLARHGTEVIAIECDRELASDLRVRADAASLPVSVLGADMRSLARLDLPGAPAIAVAPLHVIQQLDPGDRPAVLGALARRLAPGGLFAAALVDESSLLSEGLAPGSEAPLPEMREVEGWVYSSEPLWVQVGDDTLRVRRLRQLVSPEGEIERTVAEDLVHRVDPIAFEAEAERAGFEPVKRERVRSGPNESASIVTVMRVTS